jgi:hypothetical protein
MPALENPDGSFAKRGASHAVARNDDSLTRLTAFLSGSGEITAAVPSTFLGIEKLHALFACAVKGGGVWAFHFLAAIGRQIISDL